MKHLLNGVAIAAALAIVTPALAQVPGQPSPTSGIPKAGTASPTTSSATPSAPAAAAPAPMAPAGAPPTAHRQRHVRTPATHAAHGRTHGPTGDQMTTALNREELARIQGAGAPPPMPGGAYGQPSPTAGIPKGSTPSPSTNR